MNERALHPMRVMKIMTRVHCAHDATAAHY